MQGKSSQSAYPNTALVVVLQFKTWQGRGCFDTGTQIISCSKFECDAIQIHMHPIHTLYHHLSMWDSRSWPEHSQDSGPRERLWPLLLPIAANWSSSSSELKVWKSPSIQPSMFCSVCEGLLAFFSAMIRFWFDRWGGDRYGDADAGVCSLEYIGVVLPHFCSFLKILVLELCFPFTLFQAGLCTFPITPFFAFATCWFYIWHPFQRRDFGGFLKEFDLNSTKIINTPNLLS